METPLTGIAVTCAALLCNLVALAIARILNVVTPCLGVYRQRSAPLLPVVYSLDEVSNGAPPS